ncbi:MAG: hypothetical protein IT550_12100 [Novosphingobium sp.]|nr:hypothetical protein [Novosphingobium sp.]
MIALFDALVRHAQADPDRLAIDPLVGITVAYDEAGLVDAIAAGGFAPDGISVHAAPVTRSVKGLLALARR